MTPSVTLGFVIKKNERLEAPRLVDCRRKLSVRALTSLSVITERGAVTATKW